MTGSGGHDPVPWHLDRCQLALGGPGDNRVFGSDGRILLPDTPFLSPWRSPGYFEVDKTLQGLGEDPSINQSALKKSARNFLRSRDLFDFWVHHIIS